jgi:hypothetical protein
MLDRNSKSHNRYGNRVTKQTGGSSKKVGWEKNEKPTAKKPWG